MYDVQTILSAYDKQGTLVQWLKNLDEVLKTSGLESVNTIPVEGGYKLQFNFANGVVLESDLIQKITTLDIEADSVKLALTDTNGVVIEYYSTLTVNGENVESNIKLLFPIKGSESVIVDVDENGTAIEIHLDADIISDINRALKIPVGTIPSTELVAVTPSKEQKLLNVGNGLKIENDTLSAEATGGGNYVLELTGESGTLTDEQYQAVVDNFPNVTLLYNGALVTSTMVKIGDEYGFYVTVSLPIGLTTTIITISTNKTWTMQQSVIPPSTGSGLQVKQITFTDRPSLYSWLQSNYTKIVKILLTFGAYTFDFTNNIMPTSSNLTEFYGSIENIKPVFDDSLENIIGTQVEFTYVIIYNNKIVVNVAGSNVAIIDNEANFNDTPPVEIEDNQWIAQNITLLITYVE